MLKKLCSLICLAVVMASTSIAVAKSKKPIPLNPTVKPSKIIEPASYLVYDLAAKKPLFQKNVKAVRPVASLTKLLAAMTYLTEKENIPTSALASPVYLDPSEDLDVIKGTALRMSLALPYTRESLFKLAMVNSNNNATYALSRSIPGVARPLFVTKMQTLAHGLGMSKSNFVEPTGLSAKNVSTAEDLLKLAFAARTYPELVETAKLRYVTEKGQSGAQAVFKNTNKLISEEAQQARLSKTGYTKEAGFNLIYEPEASACKGGSYLIIVLGAKSALSRTTFMHNVLRRVGCMV